ncbi:hypothetical protein PNEG_01880 [Pneumocystis murina B123]|uniref:Protein ORM1 n=1 Tax=Pneumocystis murina (strain B123) TaxID=1069680 RepID=M7NLZ6_PNEMU|nr:hypothetical protein PNEG_01880 [Pneumocystis murina B123]EMR09693.1 hypothetical protein PNEG_01880 [Pneumocystis murina B123]
MSYIILEQIQGSDILFYDMCRRSSSIIHDVQASTADDSLDQGSQSNFNCNWGLGAWIIHIVVISYLKIFYNAFPAVSQELSWTLTNLTYMLSSYIMFHWVKGIPFEFNSGAYDNLTMWEQMDNGAQYTPAKKYLTAVPITLFLLSTHYTHYDFWTFFINLWALLMVLVPKLPSTHRKRIFGINKFDLN